jgi:hypothetical protein
MALRPQARDDRAHRLREEPRRDREAAVQAGRVGGDHGAHPERQVELIRAPHVVHRGLLVARGKEKVWY